MKFRENNIRERLASGSKAVGAWAQISSPEIVEIMGNTGFDFVIIDLEHGSFYLETAVQMIRAAELSGITPVVRVPDKTPSFIMRMLDAGAQGVLVPGISSKQDAEIAVAAMRYSPAGNRGACPGVRAAGHQAESWPEFVKWSNENAMAWMLVEGVDGINNFDQIIEVPGIHAIMMGPFDLSQALGYPGQTSHPKVVEKIEEIVRKARVKNIEVVAVIFSITAQEMQVETKHWVDLGCRIVAAGSDRRLIGAGFKSVVSALTPVGAASKTASR
jgi:4-hydroxy-2-oxoheptanedioate aldolase